MVLFRTSETSLTRSMLMIKKRKNSRGYSLRKVNTRETRQRFLIVCEGSKTEPTYFESFRVPKDVIDVKGLGQNPSKLIDSAEKFNDTDDYDRVWCVFDRDSWTPQDFNKAFVTAKKLGFQIAYSNESFELWYVLHFQFLNTGIPRKDYCDKLTNLLGYKNKKNSEMMYEALLDKQSIAIKNAENLLKQYRPNNPEKDNPSTTVHLLVQELNKFIR